MNAIPSLEEITLRIRSFLFENYLFGYEEKDLNDDDSFMELGLLDSTGILELIMFVETEYEIEVEHYEIIPENIDSVSNISGLVYGKIKKN